MHLYWRVIEELKYLGETWNIHDPSLLRCYKAWILKNSESISIEFNEVSPGSSTIFTYKNIPCSFI